MERPSADAIERHVRESLAEIMGGYPGDFDADTPFPELGLDSVVGLALLSDLEDWLDRRFAPTLLLQHASIRALVAHLGA